MTWNDWLPWLVILVLLALTGGLLALILLQEDEVSNEQTKKLFQSCCLFLGRLSQNRSRQIDLPLYYINLARSTDRRQRIEEQLAGTTLTRIEGVNGRDDPSVTYINDFSDLTSGEIGCTLSHLRAIKTAYDAGHEAAVILEDDASFLLAPFWSYPLSYYVTKAPLGWNILKLFSNHSYPNTGSDFIRPFWFSNSATGYIINRVGMKRILDRVYREGCFYLSSHLSRAGQADYYIYLVAPENQIFLINPALIIPDNSSLASTIHEDHTPSHLRLACPILARYRDQVIRDWLPRVDSSLLNNLIQPEMIIDRQSPPTKLDIVIASYRHSLRWLVRFLRALPRDSYRLFIYSKGDTPSLDNSLIDCLVKLPNVGRAQHSYVYHVWSCSHRSETTFFLQDSTLSLITEARLTELLHSPPAHPVFAQTVVVSGKALGDFSLDHRYQTTGQNPADPFIRSALRPLRRWYEAVMGQPYSPTSSLSSRQGLVVTPSDRLDRVSRSCWERILFTLSSGSHLETALYLERIWSQIL